MHALDPSLPDAPGRWPRVLVVAPEGGRSSVVEGLREHDIAVLVAPTGAVLEQLGRGDVDLVLLHSDAGTAHRQLVELRESSQVPVVVALREARSGLDRFLEAGADDCVLSSVTRHEVVARVRAVLRRTAREEQADVVVAGPFCLDPARRVFSLAGQVIHLPPKEFGLLELLLRRDGRVVSREEALRTVWAERPTGGDPTTVDVHVKRLRAKLERDPAAPVHLLTVRGLGYRFQV